MRAFLEEVSDHVLENYPDDTGDLCIVTPNRRAGLFFRKYFASRIKAPMWSPEVLSIEDFINSISGYAICEKPGIFFEFYTVYRQIEKESADDIDRFFAWAPALIRDFDDIDNALADPETLFDYLKNIRHIDTWNPDGSELTDFQQGYLSFIKKMGTYHSALHEHLTGKNLAWQGLSSRQAARKIEAGDTSLPWKKILFTGFNALTGAEEQIIHTLLREGHAEYITDADPFYVNNPGHEAGHFIRKYRKKFPAVQREQGEGFFRSGLKKIRIYGLAKNVNQARLAGNLIKEIPSMSNHESTAVVLANEQLLIPMLNALPKEAEDINVTMGYPLSKTNMSGFFDTLFQLHLRAFAPGKNKDKQCAFYHKDLYRLFSHSNSGLLWDMDTGDEQCSGLLQRMNESNQSHYTFGQLVSLSEDPRHFSERFSFLDKNWQTDVKGIFSSVLALSEQFDLLLREKAGKQGRDIVNTPFFADFESLYYFARIFRQMESFLARFPFLASLKTLYRLMRQITAETRLSFSGEPLKGLQVMGMLETRSLDFKNVILLSVNENILPKPKSNYSFIPYEVKKSFGLRLYHEQDAIYAYHFYRLLQRAENICLIYNTQTQDIGSSEKSRYITQLQYEMPQYNPNTDIREEIVSVPPPMNECSAEISIPKTEDVMTQLNEMAKKGFSPSALARYINCPLQFYFERLARIEESDEVEETLEARTIGNIVHGVMEDLYRKHTGQILQTAHIQAMEKQLEEHLKKRFEKEYRGGNIHAGKNLLLYHLTRRFVENLLKAERTAIQRSETTGEQITLLSLEEPLQATLEMRQKNGGMIEVTIAGKADRIDCTAKAVRVIDYKTGKIQSSELSFAGWDLPFTKSEKLKNFQLLCYAWLYHQAHSGVTQIEPGIISTRNPARGLQTMKHPGGKGILKPDDLRAFETRFIQMLGELMDPDMPFRQTGEEKNCSFCMFSHVCRRF